jgi:hypothetical protein
MKAKLIFSSLLVLSILLSSCKKEEEEDTTTSTTPKEIIMPRVQGIPSGTYVQPNNQNVTPVQSQTITPTTQAVNQTPVVTKPGMNPPHGQPGHRCDISVGAPLNSPVAKPASQETGTVQPTTITSIPTTTTTTTTANPSTPAILNSETTATAPGMNPPHGEAGHVCGTAVGAPLAK